MKPLIRAAGIIGGLIRAEYRQITNRYFSSIERFPGSAKEVCGAIVDRLWYGNFYRTSLGHYNFFWMRDFATVSASLTRLNHTTRVHHTLRWALRHYMRAGRVKTCVDSFGSVFNAPGKPSIDALPWLLHSIVVSNYRLNEAERTFLNQELIWYCDKFLRGSGDIRSDTTYAEMRDAVYYTQSAYAVALVGRMAVCIDELGLKNFPYDPAIYRDLLLERYWTGEYFQMDRVNPGFSAESALMPFFLELIDDKEKFNSTVNYIVSVKLNQPYPLKYGYPPKKKLRYRWGMGPVSMPNYTVNSIWTWHATFYLHCMLRYKHPLYEEEYARFAALIERHGTYPELTNPDGSWYYAPFYRADPGMVWAALFLELPEK